MPDAALVPVEVAAPSRTTHVLARKSAEKTDCS